MVVIDDILIKSLYVRYICIVFLLSFRGIERYTQKSKCFGIDISYLFFQVIESRDNLWHSMPFHFIPCDQARYTKISSDLPCVYDSLSHCIPVVVIRES